MGVKPFRGQRAPGKFMKKYISFVLRDAIVLPLTIGQARQTESENTDPVGIYLCLCVCECVCIQFECVYYTHYAYSGKMYIVYYSILSRSSILDPFVFALWIQFTMALVKLMWLKWSYMCAHVNAHTGACFLLKNINFVVTCKNKLFGQ